MLSRHMNLPISTQFSAAAARSLDDDRLALIGRCVDCGDEGLRCSSSAFTCGRCGRTFSFDEDGILLATPAERPVELAVYRSRLFRDWIEAWKREINDWVIYKNAFFRYFSMSGHTAVVKAIRSAGGGDPVIVDFGCGAGQLFQLYPERLGIGIDSNLEFLRLMRQRHPQVLAVHGDICNTPFRSEALVCPISVHTLEHIYHLGECASEIARVLAPAGRFIFSLPTEGGLGWSLGRKLVTGPRLRRRYDLDVQEVMEIEHINDARRVLRFLKWTFAIESLRFSPF